MCWCHPWGLTEWDSRSRSGRCSSGQVGRLSPCGLSLGPRPSSRLPPCQTAPLSVQEKDGLDAALFERHGVPERWVSPACLVHTELIPRLCAGSPQAGPPCCPFWSAHSHVPAVWATGHHTRSQWGADMESREHSDFPETTQHVRGPPHASGLPLTSWSQPCLAPEWGLLSEVRRGDTQVPFGGTGEARIAPGYLSSPPLPEEVCTSGAPGWACSALCL